MAVIIRNGENYLRYYTPQRYKIPIINDANIKYYNEQQTKEFFNIIDAKIKISTVSCYEDGLHAYNKNIIYIYSYNRNILDKILSEL